FFITPALLGGRKEQMLSNLIQIQVVDLLNWPFASAMSTILLIVTLVIFFIYNRFLGAERLWGGVKT
ncbi:MAG: ABC transporter permease, partial [Deltaproteobacteria bacterium]